METFPRYWPFVRGIHRSQVSIKYKTNPSHFIINGDKIDNKDDIANNFNSFNQNIGQTLNANIIQEKNYENILERKKATFYFQFSLLKQEIVFKIIGEV